MGLIEFLILCVVVVALGACAVWCVGYFGGPASVIRIIWAVVIFVIVLTLLNATGVLQHDIRIPHV